MENASHRYNGDRVKAMIRHQKDKYGWEFLFLGDNIDAVDTAGRSVRCDAMRRRVPTGKSGLMRILREENNTAGIDFA